jgi:hypothetical protein
MIDRLAKIVFTYYSIGGFKPAARVQTLILLAGLTVNVLYMLILLFIILISIINEQVEIAVSSISMETGIYTSFFSYILLILISSYCFHKKIPVFKRDAELARNKLRLNTIFFFIMAFLAISLAAIVIVPLEYFVYRNMN